MSKIPFGFGFFGFQVDFCAFFLENLDRLDISGFLESSVKDVIIEIITPYISKARLSRREWSIAR